MELKFPNKMDLLKSLMIIRFTYLPKLWTGVGPTTRLTCKSLTSTEKMERVCTLSQINKTNSSIFILSLSQTIAIGLSLVLINQILKQLGDLVQLQKKNGSLSAMNTPKLMVINT
jgi:hypothetical protein